jgi:hypothetical protein
MSGTGGRGGLPMSQRVRLGSDPGPGRRGVDDDGCPARHCWVADAADGAGVKRPGLLVEWREVVSGWEGRVVYVAGLHPHAWSLVEEWLPASSLTPR